MIRQAANPSHGARRTESATQGFVHRRFRGKCFGHVGLEQRILNVSRRKQGAKGNLLLLVCDAVNESIAGIKRV
jgi:hypothetical protein